MLKKSISIITAITIFSGCAVKQEDSTATKALKHTVNAPAYIVLGVGMIGTLAVQGAVLGTATVVTAPVKAVKSGIQKDENTVDKREVEVNEEEKIDSLKTSAEDIPIENTNSLSNTTDTNN